MGKISIVGLGPGDRSLISQGAIKALKSNSRIFFRTEKHPIVDELNSEIDYTSLDYFYESEDSFENVYTKISEFIVDESCKGDLVYAVPGHPRVAEKTVGIIEDIACENQIEVDIIPSMSFVDAIFNYLSVDPSEGFQLLDAFELEDVYIDTNKSMIITQIYDNFTASNVKLRLSEYYEYDQEIYIVKAAGIKGLENKKAVKLYELDRKDNRFDYLTSLYIPKSSNKMYNTVHDLEMIVKKLRGPNGCEWDKKQTHESLKKFLIEESYELINAIDNNDDDEIVEELGDVLLQVALHCQIGKEEGYFDLAEVVSGICKKLINRHPHVFNAGDNRDFSEKTWEELKKEEKGEEAITDSMVRIPESLPALMKATKVQKKAALVGFDWDNIEDVFKKIEEEYHELLDECRVKNIKYIKEELGDLIFSIVNLARFLGIDSEEALNSTTAKFIYRFQFIEQKSVEIGKKLEDMTLEEMDYYWNQAKIQKDDK
ncbi:nucleoside triphosphate pyrophosphohydrolase [Metaclostridioides mangenotii]|uniref:nucleoside triphosphate pyrophosphohydrolase n=1 Tax=Metaclostridioides mangenotii TaxID=1540 RepID=UPI000482FF71|nr:nucleoside triphosphate pyrophosphohydrolase [Clostridioides mangenotii]